MTGHLQASAEASSVHKYLLACCRRIWPLIPDSGSRMGIEAGEKYCRGEIAWEEARQADWYSEAEEQSARELLKDAVYFANFALCYPAIRFGRSTKGQLETYGKFMPLELFEAMLPGIVD